ncbi:MAG: extensin-like domain-containing protein [Shimia sp.]
MACGTAGATGPDASPRPAERPGAVIAAAQVANLNPAAVPQSARPERRTQALAAEAQRILQQRARGTVCRDPDIVGRPMAPIAGRVQGCGQASPVSVTQVAGVRLSVASTLDCRTARALKRWVQEGVKPAVGTRGGGVASLRIVGHYVCRTRNHRPGGRISEHGRARAIDVAGIGLRDGSEMTLLTGWNDPGEAQAWRRMWRAACGPFGTVLGPEADRFHLDHFHFDTARYRSGSYCR